VRPYLDDGDVLIHLGDCRDVMAAMEPESVDAIVTDPPYGLDASGGMLGQVSRGTEQRGAFAYGGTHSRGYADHDPRAFQKWCAAWGAEAYRLLPAGGHLLAFGAPRTSHRMTVALEEAGFEVRDGIAWTYENGGIPKSPHLLRPGWETVGVFRKPLRFATLREQVAKTGVGALFVDSSEQWPSNVREVPKPSPAERDGATHPTVKPLALMRWLVRLVTPPGGMVLDPFAGSGTTLLAARDEGFRSIGIEWEPEYAAMAAHRLRQLSLLGGAA